MNKILTALLITAALSSSAAFAEDTLVLRLQLTIVLHLVIDGVALWALLMK